MRRKEKHIEGGDKSKVSPPNITPAANQELSHQPLLAPKTMSLKRALTTAPILSPPDWDQEFHVTLDASGWCLGAILWQYQGDWKEGPICYASRQMSPAERNYTTTEREALAVVYACRKFRHYLLGYRVVFHTDHNSLKYLVNKLDLSGRITRWILLLEEFNYEVVVKPGKTKSNADYLFRQRGTEATSTILPLFPNEFMEEEAKAFPGDIPVFHLFGEEPHMKMSSNT